MIQVSLMYTYIVIVTKKDGGVCLCRLLSTKSPSLAHIPCQGLRNCWTVLGMQNSQGILAGTHGSRGQREDCIYQPQRFISVYNNAFWSKVEHLLLFSV